MNIGNILIVAYFILGLILSIYWFNTEYIKKYAEIRDKGEEENGMTNIFLLSLILFWPIKLFKKIIRK